MALGQVRQFGCACIRPRRRASCKSAVFTWRLSVRDPPARINRHEELTVHQSTTIRFARLSPDVSEADRIHPSVYLDEVGGHQGRGDRGQSFLSMTEALYFLCSTRGAVAWFHETIEMEIEGEIRQMGSEIVLRSHDDRLEVDIFAPGIIRSFPRACRLTSDAHWTLPRSFVGSGGEGMELMIDLDVQLDDGCYELGSKHTQH